MAKVEEIKVLNIDGDKKTVEDLPEEAQQLVQVYNEWNQEEADLRQQLMKTQSAKNELSRQIIAKVREHEEGGSEDAANQDS